MKSKKCPSCGFMQPALGDAFCSQCFEPLSVQAEKHGPPSVTGPLPSDPTQMSPAADNPWADAKFADGAEQIKQGPLKLALFCLLLPLAAGASNLLMPYSSLTFPVAGGTVFLTAVLLAIDAEQLGRVDKRGRRRENGFVVFLSVCLLWVVGFPAAYFRRSAFTQPRLGWAALGVAVFFAGGPLGLLMQPKVPPVSNSEVQRLVSQLVENMHLPGGAQAPSNIGNSATMLTKELAMASVWPEPLRAI